MKSHALNSAYYPLAASLMLSCAFSACSSDTARHPSLVEGPGGASNSSAGAGFAGRASSNVDEAGAGGDSRGLGGNQNAGGDGGDGEAPALELGGSAPMASPAVCPQMATWAMPSSLDGVSSSAAETLLSITLDELDLAFLRAGTLYVAHRASRSAAFAVTPVVPASGWSAANGASLSADGKRLILVSDPAQNKLGELTRGTRDQPFSSAVDESAFASINSDALYTGKVYASPVVSGRDDQLIFNSAYLGSASTVVYSTRSGDAAWSSPRQLQTKVLDGGAHGRRLPTGLSADQRTLFYFNEEALQEEARWRSADLASSPLYDVVSLGMRRGAAPNAACDHLYSGAEGDVVVETE